MSTVVLACTFVALALLRSPIAIAITLAAFAALLTAMRVDTAAMTLAQKVAAAGFNFTLVAIPLFVLAGKLMAVGGVARRLIEFARVSVGWLPGGLAVTNVLANLLFGSISGSAAASASGIGGFMVPAMQREGYPRPFSAALTATAATTGLLIPPSNVMLVYATVAGGVSIAALFVAGYVPGLMLGLALMLAAVVLSRRARFGVRHPRPSARVLARASIDMLPSATMLILIMGGIVGGLFTPTEAGAVAVLYAAVLTIGIYREVSARQLVGILRDTAAITGMVFLLIGASLGLAWVFAWADVPAQIGRVFALVSGDPWITLLLVNLVLLAVGTFMDITPALLIFTPIFLPLMVSMAPMFGLSADEMRYHFGIVMVFNLCLGLVTPPTGTTLYIAAGIARVGIHEVIRPLLPLLVVAVVVLALVSVNPTFTLALPRALGLM